MKLIVGMEGGWSGCSREDKGREKVKIGEKRVKEEDEYIYGETTSNNI